MDIVICIYLIILITGFINIYLDIIIYDMVNILIIFIYLYFTVTYYRQII